MPLNHHFNPHVTHRLRFPLISSSNTEQDTTQLLPAQHTPNFKCKLVRCHQTDYYSVITLLNLYTHNTRTYSVTANTQNQSDRKRQTLAALTSTNIHVSP